MSINAARSTTPDADWTTPPDRVVGHLEEIGTMWAKLPQVLPQIVADPGSFVDASEPLGGIARRLVSIPEVGPPASNTDGEVEYLQLTDDWQPRLREGAGATRGRDRTPIKRRGSAADL